MSQLVQQIRRAADVEVLTSVPARRVFAVITFALLTAFSAHVSVPLTPVPVSLQTLMVLLSGLLLGASLGATSQLAYVLAGAAGLPVFAGGAAGAPYLFGPTGGYLLAFPAAAAVAGFIAARGGARAGVIVLTVAAVAATATVYAGGWSQLAFLTGDAQNAFRVGVLPFLVGDAAKVVVAVLLALRLRRRTTALL